MLASENFKRGTTELVVLRVLHKADMYGYQIVQELERMSEGKYKLVLGTLYPVLYRFVENGYISDRDEVANGRLRKYYHLEDKGREYYKELLCEYRKISEGVELITKGGEDDD